eukprot:1196356-Prorocentrum_minimum.AAC.6
MEKWRSRLSLTLTLNCEVANCIVEGARNARGGKRLHTGGFADVCAFASRMPSRQPVLTVEEVGTLAFRFTPLAVFIHISSLLRGLRMELSRARIGHAAERRGEPRQARL